MGAYDLINEPNWDFERPGGGHGCEETTNAPLRSLMMEITTAIREVDRRHLIFIEGNCWGNNYRGVLPVWDDNMALSFHKYWNPNDPAAIADIIRLRDAHQVPIWLGESGENSNTWFRDAIALIEDEGIGWAFWPLKKFGFNQPLQVRTNPGWAPLVEHLTGRGPPVDPTEAEATLMRLATHDIRFENNIVRRDVVDAMLRQPHSDAVVPFADHRIGADAATVAAADYDMGRAGFAWSDRDDADYRGPRERIWWNTGRTYRNDGVDIRLEADGRPIVTGFLDGEWMRYTVVAEAGGPREVVLRVRSRDGDRLSLTLNGGASVALAPGPADAEGWRTASAPALPLVEGRNTMILKADVCDCEVRALEFRPQP